MSGKRDRRDTAGEQSLERIAQAVRRRNRQAEQFLEQKKRRAHREVDRLVAEFLDIDPDLDKVLLFGSLARNQVRSEYFDIDLAVRSNRFLQLVACGLRSTFSVELVELDRVPAPMRTAIKRYGKIVYEKKKLCSEPVMTLGF